jgi:hypothetical protein
VELLAIVSGLFGGIGAIICWEVFIRPPRQGRDLAELLMMELSLNSGLLGSAIVSARSNQVPQDFRLATTLFTTHSGGLVHLPARLAGRVTNLYFVLDKINECPILYERYVDTLRQTDDVQIKLMIAAEAEAVVSWFHSRVRLALDRMGPIQDELYGLAYPWWSWRRWTRPKLEAETLKDVGERLAAGTARRHAIMEEVKRNQR